jgi:hypothetical protein
MQDVRRRTSNATPVVEKVTERQFVPRILKGNLRRMRRRESPVILVERRVTQRTSAGRRREMEMQLPLQLQMLQERMSPGCCTLEHLII